VISCTFISYGKMTQNEVGGLLGWSYNQIMFSATWAYQDDGVAHQGYVGEHR
jgi:hypothetical protein